MAILPSPFLSFIFLKLVMKPSIESHEPVVTLLQSNEKTLRTFSLLKASNSNLPGNISLTGTIETCNVITLPAGTTVLAMKPTFTVSAGAKITVMGITQISVWPEWLLLILSPSLLYALLMMGTMLVILFLADGADNTFTRWLTFYGRFLMFYYIIHWYYRYKMNHPMIAILR